jgi:hypothetical protein
VLPRHLIGHALPALSLQRHGQSTIDSAGKYHEYVIPGLTRNPVQSQQLAYFERHWILALAGMCLYRFLPDQ